MKLKYLRPKFVAALALTALSTAALAHSSVTVHAHPHASLNTHALMELLALAGMGVCIAFAIFFTLSCVRNLR